MIKPTSKTLFRHIENGVLEGMTYHDTKVVKKTSDGKVIFNSNGWHIMNTVRAMTFALDEMGYSHLSVVYRNNKKLNGLFLVKDGVLSELVENEAIRL